MNRTGFHHCALKAVNMEETIRFYEGIGCSLIRTWGEGIHAGCMMDAGGGNIIEIFVLEKEEKQENPRFAHLAFKTEDPDADFENAVSLGAKPETYPKDVTLGKDFDIRVAFVWGPSGELIEFFKER